MGHKLNISVRTGTRRLEIFHLLLVFNYRCTLLISTRCWALWCVRCLRFYFPPGVELYDTWDVVQVFCPELPILWLLNPLLAKLSHFIIVFWKTLILLTLKPSRCIKASFYIPENKLNFPITKVLEWKFPWNRFTNTWQFSVFFKPH